MYFLDLFCICWFLKFRISLSGYLPVQGIPKSMRVLGGCGRHHRVGSFRHFKQDMEMGQNNFKTYEIAIWLGKQPTINHKPAISGCLGSNGFDS